MTIAEINARNMIARRPLKKLIEDFELLDARIVDADHKITTEEIMVRGWIMDELEARNPEAYEAWIDDDDYEASPRKHFLH